MLQKESTSFSKIFCSLFLSAMLCPIPAIADDVFSVLLKKTPDGHLSPVPDSQGNTIPDFSWVGYRNGEIDIPTVPVVKTISPVPGDNLKNIQDAVDAVSAMPLVNGFRGAILLKPGTYNISEPIKISSSGVVIRGSGTGSDGTLVIATAPSQKIAVFNFAGGGDIQITGTTANLRRKTVLDSYLPFGSRVLTVDSNHAFKVGDRVIVKHTHNNAWINLINMAQYGWTQDIYVFNYKRNILSISGNKITIDAPLVEPIDKKYGDAELIAYSWPSRIENTGIENIRLDSVYSSATDENHTMNGVYFAYTENAWVRNVDVYHTIYSAVNVAQSSSNISVLNSKMIDPISQITGERRYSFNISGQRSLVRGCYARNGRHDYVTGARTAGPNVFTENQAVNQYSDIGPHHRWATGTLFDSITADGSINVQNRTSSGSGHGWAGAETMLWNCTAQKIVIQSPPNFINWAIGSKATVTYTGTWVTAPGYKELTGQTAWPQSLYEQQMCDRLGKLCPDTTITVTAKNQSIKQGSPLPSLTYSLSLDTTLQKNPVCSTIATSQSPVGSYSINCAGAEKPGYTFRYIPGMLTIAANTTANGTLEVLPSTQSDKNCSAVADVLYLDNNLEGKNFTTEKSFSLTLPAGQHKLALASQSSPVEAGGTLKGTCTGTLTPQVVTIRENTKTTSSLSYTYNTPDADISCKITAAKVDSQLNWGKIVNKFTVSVLLNASSTTFPIKVDGDIIMTNPFVQNLWGNFSLTSSWKDNASHFTGETWKNAFTLEGYISNLSALSLGDNPLQSLTVNGVICN